MATIKIGAIGDSITAGNGGDPVGEMVSALNALGHTASATNRGIAGTSTADWLPTGSNLPAARSAITSAGANVVHLMLGTNDSKTANNIAPAAHFANMQAIVTYLLAAVPVVVVHRPLWIVGGGDWPADPNTPMAAYWAQDTALINNATVFMGDTAANVLTTRDTSRLSDGVHPTGAMNLVLGDLWATAVAKRFDGVGNGTIAASLRGGFAITNPGYSAVPSAITGFASSAATATTITLTWTETGAQVDTRTVTYRPAGSGSYAAVPGVTFSKAGATVSAAVTGLTAATAYDFRELNSNTLGAGTAATLLNVSTTSSGRVLPTVAAASPSVWFDASKATTLFSDTALTTQAPATNGGTVQGWKDALGSTKAVVQATSGSAPTYAVAKANNRNMLAFSGSQLIRSAAGSTWVNAMTKGLPFTARVVFISTNTGTNMGVVTATPAGATSFSPGTEVYAQGSTISTAFDGSSADKANAIVANAVVSLVVRYDGTNVYVRRTAGGADTTGNFAGTGTTLDQMTFGFLPQVNWYLSGFFGEFALWPGLATSAEADTLLNDAVSWWGN